MKLRKEFDMVNIFRDINKLKDNTAPPMSAGLKPNTSELSLSSKVNKKEINIDVDSDDAIPLAELFKKGLRVLINKKQQEQQEAFKVEPETVE
jgi:hypothetical protein